MAQWTAHSLDAVAVFSGAECVYTQSRFWALHAEHVGRCPSHYIVSHYHHVWDSLLSFSVGRNMGHAGLTLDLRSLQCVQATVTRRRFMGRSSPPPLPRCDPGEVPVGCSSPGPPFGIGSSFCSSPPLIDGLRRRPRPGIGVPCTGEDVLIRWVDRATQSDSTRGFGSRNRGVGSWFRVVSRLPR